MDQQDQIRAFALRCQGMTWAQIGQVMHYDEQTISKSLHAVIKKQSRRPKIRYPRLQEYVNTHYDGSLRAFAEGIGASPYRLRRVLVFGDPPGPSLRRKILSASNLPPEQAFAVSEEKEMGCHGD